MALMEAHTITKLMWRSSQDLPSAICYLAEERETKASMAGCRGC